MTTMEAVARGMTKVAATDMMVEVVTAVMIREADDITDNHQMSVNISNHW